MYDPHTLRHMSLPPNLYMYIVPGAPKTTFMNNNSTVCGGHVSAAGAAVVDIHSAAFIGGISNVGGALCVFVTANMSITDCVLSGAVAANGHGGCMAAEQDATLRIMGTTLAGCDASQIGGCGGGIGARDQARVVVLNSTISNTTAQVGGAVCVYQSSFVRLESTVISGCSCLGSGGAVLVQSVPPAQARFELLSSTISRNAAGSNTQVTTDGEDGIAGGGVCVLGSASILLGESELTKNYAKFAGGGLYLHADSTTLFQGTKPTMVHNNTAGQVGGGIRVASRLAEAAMSRFFRVDGNTAPKSPDVSVTAVLIQVVSSNG